MSASMSSDRNPLVRLAPIRGLRCDLTLQTHDPSTDLLSRKLHAERQWEPFETKLWVASQQAEAVVVDVGANLGYFSLLSAQHERKASRIFAFEPAADNVALLSYNLDLNDAQRCVDVHAIALGDCDTNGSLHRNEDNRGDHQIYPGDGERVKESIAVRQGADLLSPMVSHINLLKVDTQGSEYGVILGLLPLLRASGDGLRILLELTPYSLRLANSSGRALVTLVASLGLPLWIVDHIEHRLVPSDAEALCEWSDNVDSVSGDRGFMNIFVGIAPQGLPA